MWGEVNKKKYIKNNWGEEVEFQWPSEGEQVQPEFTESALCADMAPVHLGKREGPMFNTKLISI